MHPIRLMAQGGADLLAGLPSLGLISWLLALLGAVFWLWMLIDALVTERSTVEKILWFLVIFCLNFVGALIYFCARRVNGRGAPA
jgi:hypothetical protein